MSGRTDTGRPVLDPCSGSRMFYFDRADPRVVFGDIRSETHELKDRSSAGGTRELIIAPDQVMDFRSLPFPDEQFHLVVFDPPHLTTNGASGWLAKKYGKLGDDWRADIRKGFQECFRILKPFGTLIFKWNEHEIPVREIIALTDAAPLFGNRCGKTAKTHWIVFMKDVAMDAESIPHTPDPRRERLARAMTAHSSRPWEDMNENTRKLHLDEADRLLAAIDRAD